MARLPRELEEYLRLVEESEELSAQTLELYDIMLLKALFGLQNLALGFLDNLEKSSDNKVKTTSANKKTATKIYIDFIHQANGQFSLVSDGFPMVYEPTVNHLDEALIAGGIAAAMMQGDKEILRVSQNRVRGSLERAAQAVFEQIGQMFIVASVVGTSLGELRGTIINKLSGSLVPLSEEVPVGQRLQSIAESIAHDDFMDMYRNHLWSAATRAGINKFLYAGRQVQFSRMFCIPKKGNVFTSEQIIAWNKENWKGKRQGIDVRIALGGWACIDHLFPVPKNLEESAESIRGTFQDRLGAIDGPILGEKERKLLPVVLRLHNDWNTWAAKNGLLMLRDAHAVLPGRFLPAHWRQAEAHLAEVFRRAT